MKPTKTQIFIFLTICAAMLSQILIYPSTVPTKPLKPMTGVRDILIFDMCEIPDFPKPCKQAQVQMSSEELCHKTASQLDQEKIHVYCADKIP